MALLCLVRSQAGCYCADREVIPPLGFVSVDPDWGVYMRMMHLCYAAIGFAVARWIFKRQAVVDPVTRFRSQGLL
jgi:hypothetical protein